MDANKNHGRPHVHIDYGRSHHAASYAIDNGERLIGESKYDREISEWIGKHRPKLLEVWNLMQAGKDAAPVVCELRGKETM
jgi:adenosyl cobinamide kinase/adenosyl cobinamide phosphate guanylyltransferase